MDEFHPEFIHSHQNLKQRFLIDMVATATKQSPNRADVSEKKSAKVGKEGVTC